MVDLDVHPRFLTRILRHADMRMTMELYAQASDGGTRAALCKLADSFD